MIYCVIPRPIFRSSRGFQRNLQKLPVFAMCISSTTERLRNMHKDRFKQQLFHVTRVINSGIQVTRVVINDIGQNIHV